jgi:hypothetical protein
MHPTGRLGDPVAHKTLNRRAFLRLTRNRSARVSAVATSSLITEVLGSSKEIIKAAIRRVVVDPALKALGGAAGADPQAWAKRAEHAMVASTRRKPTRFRRRLAFRPTSKKKTVCSLGAW